ncbi:MAG: protein-glutamate O-methyltransferase CheR [Myxococcales bacterium]|nr:protein-glutamate O-methyltransferase CheR [Myxococcales bacterium]
MSDKMNLSKEEFEQLRDFVKKECGIAVGDEKSYLIETRLSTLVIEAGCESFGEFYTTVTEGKRTGMRDKIIDAMTTNETLWYRDAGPWTILQKSLLPRFCEQLQSGERNKIRIWSAASSTGQEPYSVALTILEYLKESGPPGVKEEMFEIHATDLSPSALFVAISARYDGLSISRGLEPDLRDRYFEKSGRVYSLCDRVKSRVAFKQFNLIESFDSFGKFDLVLCRNVLIYFSADLKRDIVGRIGETLIDNASFMVGASESLQGCMTKFSMKQCEGQFFYQRKPRGTG